MFHLPVLSLPEYVMLYTKQLNISPYKTVLEFDVDDIKHEPFAAALSQIY